MNLKICFWCEGSPKGTPCKMARELNSEVEADAKNDKGEYLQHLKECSVTVMPNCSEETKKKWKSFETKKV